MHRRGILGLLAVVGLLLLMRTWSDLRSEERAEELAVESASHALLEGLDVEDFAELRGLKIDNLTRKEQLRLERDATGRWFLTDPVAWPAELPVLRLFFETLARDRGIEVADIDAQAAGLEPPVAIAELDFGAELGKWKVEIGQPDLDGLRLYIRTTAPNGEPRLLRANRSLESVFTRFVPDYRSKSLLRLEPTEIVEVRRRGATAYASLFDEPDQIGPLKPVRPNPLLTAQGQAFPTLDLRLVDAADGWRLEEPFRAAADPQALTMLLLTLCNLDAVAFHAEDSLDPPRFGFDDPELDVELRDANGGSHRLRFAREPDERGRAELDGRGVLDSEWLCVLDERPTVFVVESRVVMLAAGPAEAFFDYRILRGEFSETTYCRIEAGGRRTELVQKDGEWTVSGRSATGQELEGLAADREAVEELLLRYRQTELGDLQPGVTPAPSFVAESLFVEGGGLRRGGTFGPPPSSSAAPYLFQRDGDEIWVSVEPKLVDHLKVGPEHFLERRLLAVEELRLGAVELTREGQTQRFVRDVSTGRWTRAGRAEEARDFAALVDRLRSIKATGFEFGVEPAGLGVGSVSVQLELVAEPGPRGMPASQVRFSIGQRPGADLYRGAEGPLALLLPGLWKGLDALFD